MDSADKIALKGWEEFHASLNKSIYVDKSESEVDKLSRMKILEADHEAWFTYYFPNYAKSEPAQFHKDASIRLIENKRWFESRMWSRELAKSTRSMMEVLFLALAKKELCNILLISNSESNAERLLLPYKIFLESNPRVINDYGVQRNLGTWESFEFVTRSGISFRALGAGQSPRGTRFEDKRVDCILLDDIDTDAECRNEALTKLKFKWFQEAVIPTVSISGNYRILVCGNLISKNSVVAYAATIAMHVDTVNIRGNDGLSSWPQKNSESDIDAILSILSYASQQKEYFNNPIVEGTVFKEMHYGQMRPIREYKFLVAYTDPSFKDSKKNDFKACVLLGRWKDEIHVIKCYCEQTTTAVMFDWFYSIYEFVNGVVPVYYYMESNFIQDSIIKQFYAESEKREVTIPLRGDTRKKDDKFTRIESALEPLNRNRKLILNEEEKTNKHMMRLEEQFLALEPGSSAHDDAPDAVEGGVYIINRKKAASTPKGMTVINKKKSSKRH